MTDANWPPWVTFTATATFYILYPVFLLLKALLYIVVLLSTPFVYMMQITVRVSMIPWRIFARFEVCHASSPAR